LPKEKCLPDDLSTSAVEASNENEMGRGKINTLAKRGAFRKLNEGRTNRNFLVVDLSENSNYWLECCESAYRIVHEYMIKVFGSRVQLPTP